MTAILWSWAVSAAVLLLLAALLGARAKLKPGPFGILIDGRGRYSLNKLQLVVWSIVVISLISGVFFGRWIDGVDDPLGFTIPDRVLGLLGIAVGGAATVAVVKANKSAISAKSDKPSVATSSLTKKAPFFAQVFMLEEGEFADEVVDATKFQSFGITVVLVVAYIALAIHEIVKAKTAGAVGDLPDLNGTFLVLLGISYAGYAGGKFATQQGTPKVEGQAP